MNMENLNKDSKKRGEFFALVQENNVANDVTATLEEGDILIKNMNSEDSNNFSMDAMRLRGTDAMRFVGQILWSAIWRQILDRPYLEENFLKRTGLSPNLLSRIPPNGLVVERG
ncbi:hypothetical protein CEXT_21171 [Caerostris extrusa]|uniref:Uncharacterized protein n=1 Tax=Caerostris extrusa TaxID=172846 RepID=A0AAV4R3R2_CAEEX|nr:hypothetical protein CEXT_21171 [Caerostris extrusa]